MRERTDAAAITSGRIAGAAGALCEGRVRHALLDANAVGAGTRAEELMQGHLVDLLSGLDLRERPAPRRRLRDMLAPAP